MAWHGARNMPVQQTSPPARACTAPQTPSSAPAPSSPPTRPRLRRARLPGPDDVQQPAGTSDAMDLAKMLACLDLIEPLAGPRFAIYRQVRTGLLSYPTDLDEARGSRRVGLPADGPGPHFVHVVGFSEATTRRPPRRRRGLQDRPPGDRNALDGQPVRRTIPVCGPPGGLVARRGSSWRLSGGWPGRRLPTPGRTPPRLPARSASGFWTPPS